MSKKSAAQFELMELHEKDLQPSPFDQFNIWFNQAIDSALKHPHAMTLSTTNEDGRPSSRMLLLKGVDEKGFRFYTNINSLKGHELKKNVFVSLCFWWEPFERQVRINGYVEMLTDSDNDEYFKTRPRGSQVGAWASDQSSVVSSRDYLEDKFNEIEIEFKDRDIPRPDYWKGYRVVPDSIEFWQGRTNRLHDRLRYRLHGNKWIIERLAP